MEPYIVYAKPDDSGYITAVNSSAFLTDTVGWVEIGRGWGDRHHHAQGNFFPQPIRTDGGAYRYKLAEGKAVECTWEELAAQEEANRPTPGPTLESRVGTLEEESAETREALNMLLSGVTE